MHAAYKTGGEMKDGGGGAEARIVGRYALHGEIAAGGMATVHYGRLIGQVGFSRTVAIKRMHPHYVKDPDFVSMLLDEARLVARIRHPNVVPVLDVVALEGELFLVMEYVLGETLSKLLRTSRRADKRPTPGMAASIIAGVMEGLHAAHEAVSEHGDPLGIVHRDVSPQNILVGADGVPRVLDFGIAKAAGRLQTTRDGQLKGKVPYMAPEQILGNLLDRRTDIFSAGAVLWEALVGHRLFQADNDVALYRKVLEEEIQSPASLVEGLPPRLVAATMKALERDPSRRFQTAQDMAVALEQAVRVVSPREIGRWVDSVAAEAIHHRTLQIKEVESGSSSIRRADFVGTAPLVEDIQSDQFSDSVVSVLSAAGASAPVLSSVSGDSPVPVATTADPVAPLFNASQPIADSLHDVELDAEERKGKSRGLLITLVAVSAVAVLIVASVIALWPGADHSASAAPATSAGPPATLVPVVSTVLPEPTTTSSADIEATAALSASASPLPASAAALPPPRTIPARPPSPPAATRTSKPPRAGCSPPYTIDGDGIRIPKPECF